MFKHHQFNSSLNYSGFVLYLDVKYKVQMYGKKGNGQGGWVDGWLKGKKSTFFPDSWSNSKIQAEIARGVKNKTPDPSFPVSSGKTAYQATMSDGTKLQIIFDGDVLNSAFPNLG